MLLRSIGYFALVDLFLALLPIVIIKDLQVSRKRKMGLGVILGLGIL